MNLEELNQQYLMLKGNLTTMRANLKMAEQEIAKLISDKKIKEGELESAKQAGDQPAQQQCYADLQKINAGIKRRQKEVETIKGNVKYLKEQIDEKINDVKEIPEVKADLEQAINKRAERQALHKSKEISKLSKEYGKLDERKTKIEAMKDLSKGQHTSNFMIGIVSADQQLKSLKSELKSLEQPAGKGLITYSNPARAAEIKNKLIPAAEKKMDANKKPLMAVIQKRKMNLTEKDIDEILLDKAILDKNGKVDFNKTFNKQLSDIEKQKIAIDKQIKVNYKKFNEFNKIYNLSNKKLEDQAILEKEEQQALATTEKPKWWQFATRFRNWLGNIKEKQAKKEKEKLRLAGFDVEDEQEQPAPEQANNEERESSSRSEFTQTLKYEIVRDSMRTVMQEYAKQQEQQTTQGKEENASDREP